MVEQENDSTLVFNNTTFNCLYAGISFRGWAAGNSDHCSVKNNIVCNQLFSNNVIEIADIGIGFQMDYNCFFHFDPSANLVHWLGNNYSAAEFEYYQDFSGQDFNSITENPLFVNIDSANFYLSAFSTCIDAGTNLGLEYDITGYPVPYGDAVDMGAYEYHDITTHILSIQNRNDIGVQVCPNPCKDRINIKVCSNKSSMVNCTILNYSGHILYEMQKRISKGESIIRTDLSCFPPGVYYIRVTIENQQESIKKLIKF
jgi:hypothetical protein